MVLLEQHKLIVDVFHGLVTVSVEVKHRIAINHQVQLPQWASSCNEIGSVALAQHAYILPKKKVHIAHLIVLARRLFDAQERLIVLENFPLVEEVYQHIYLKRIGHTRGIQVLIHINLANWDAKFEVDKLVLIYEIVQLLVHPVDHMVANIALLVDPLLQVPLFHIVVKVPGNNAKNVLIVVFRNDLQPILIHRFNDLHNLNLGTQSNFDILQNLLLLNLLQHDLHFFG